MGREWHQFDDWLIMFALVCQWLEVYYKSIIDVILDWPEILKGSSQREKDCNACNYYLRNLLARNRISQ